MFDNMKNLANPGNLYPLLIILAICSLISASSTIEACQARDMCGHWRASYGIAIGFISFIICAVVVALSIFKPDLIEKTNLYISIVLSILWILGAIFLTSGSGVFPVAGNGYFSTWFCVFSSLLYMSYYLPQVKSVKKVPSMHGITLLIIFSIICWGTAAEECGIKGDCGGRFGFALFVGPLTTVLAGTQMALYLFAGGIGSKTALPLGVVMFISWIVGCGVLTSASGPYPYVGNGYLSCWACFFASLYFALTVSPLNTGDNSGAESFDRSGSPAGEVEEFESKMSMPGPSDA